VFDLARPADTIPGMSLIVAIGIDISSAP